MYKHLNKFYTNSTNTLLELLVYHKSRQGVNGTHFFHILKPSKWPILMSFALFSLALAFIVYVNIKTSTIFSNLMFVFITFLTILYYWGFDLLNESGEHTTLVRTGIKMGMVLFIMSEVMFFFAFFWAYLHSSINPSIEIGHVWPPVGQVELLINSTELPFLNTVLLLTSGICITLVHKVSDIFFNIEEIIINSKLKKIYKTLKKKKTLLFKKICNIIYKLNYVRHFARIVICCGLLITIILALIFTIIQYNEYVEASFNISDGIYACCFFLMTGFHGIHVIVGSILLIICFFQLYKSQHYYKSMTGLECAIWYWHFVDIVWLFLYVIVYLITDEAYEHEAKVSLISRLNKLDLVFNNFVHGCTNTRIDHIGFASKNQKFFNISATTTMSEIIWLHDFIMFFIIIIFFVILALFYGILKKYTTLLVMDTYMKHIDDLELLKEDNFANEFKNDPKNAKKIPSSEEGLFRSQTF